MKHSAPLTRELESRLCAYALAAGATGLGLLASAQPSEAEIIYTPANVTITNPHHESYRLDVNGDGVTDFAFVGHASQTGFLVRGFYGRNRVIGYPTGGGTGCYASALELGHKIGPTFEACSTFQAYASMVRAWRDVSDRYLGFRFQIDDKTHFGWARMTIKVNGNIVTARLTGYAYETVANRPTHAGQTEGTDTVDGAKLEDADSDAGTMLEIPATDSLGALALGSSHPAK